MNAFLGAGAEVVVEKGSGIISLIHVLELAGERRKKEVALRQAQGQLERMGRILGFGKWEIDLETRRITGTEASRRIYGLEGRDWPLDVVQGMVLPEYRPALDRALAELIEKGTPYNVEFKIRRQADGQVADIQSVAEYDAAARKIFGVIKDITQSKQAEAALRDSERRYRLVAENVSDVIWTMSFEGRFTYISPSVYLLRGYTPEEVMRQPMEEVVCPGSLPAVQEGIGLAMKEAATGEKQSAAAYYEVEQPRKDGTTVWTEVSAGLVYDGGRPSHILGVSRDITERRRVEQALKERETELDAIFRAAPVGIVVVVDRIVWEVNETLLQMTGYRREELVGHSSRLLYASDAEFRRVGSEAYGQLAAHGSVTLETQTRRKDGSVFDTLLSATALNKDDLTRGVVFTATDISERKRAEEALKEREAKLAAVFRATPVGIAVSVNRVITEVNDTMCRMAGYSREELIGQSTRILYDTDADYERLGAELYESLKSRGQVTMEISARHKDGSHFPMLLSASPVAAGDVNKGIVFSSMDISERKQHEKLLRGERDRARQLLDIVGVMILSLDRDGKVALINNKGCEILGCKTDDVVGKDWIETFVPERTRVDLRAIFKKLIEGDIQTVEYIENPILTNNGEERFIAWHNTVIINESGEISATLSSGEDITERKRAEEALKEREAKLKAIFRTAPVGIIVVADRIVKEVNDTICRVSGYTREEIIGQSARIAYPSDQEFERVGAEVYRQLSAGGMANLETTLRRKDGSLIPVLFSASLLDPGDPAKGVVFTALDLTERKRAEEAIKEREAKLEAIFKAAPMGIVVLVDRVIRDVNDAICRMTGYTRDEMVGQSARILYLSDAEFKRVGAEAYSQLADTGMSTIEVDTRRKDGSVFRSLLSASPFNKEDLSKGVVFTALDITERTRAEEELRHSEEKYRLLFNSSNDAVYFHGQDGKFVEVNDKACQVLGYSREELLKIGYQDLNDPSVVIDEAVVWGQMAARGYAVFEHVHLAKDGRRIPVEINVNKVTIDGRAMYLSVARDITERKKAEAELRRSLSELSATLEATGDGILVVDLSGREQRYSSRFAKMWSIPKSLLDTGDDDQVLEFVLDQLTDPEGFLHRVKELYSEPEISSFDVLKLKDGRIFERYSRPQRLEGKAVGRVWSFRDVTRNKKMEEQLLQAAEQWRSTFDAIATPVSIQDRDFKILRVNKAFAVALKSKPEALIGKTCYQVSHHTSAPVPNCPHVQTLEKGVPAEVEIHDAEHGTYTIVSTYPMFGPSGEVVASVHISQDITERKKMQERLMVTDRLASVGELAAGIAHEINNPLTGVLGFSELVLSADIPESIRADVELIHSEAKRAAEVVKNLLIFARRHQQTRQDVMVNEVIAKVLALRAYEQKINNIAVVTELDPALPEICADYFQLQQVFLNIVLNAEFFMNKAHGRGNLLVTTGYRPEDQVVRIAFTDDGPGIPPDLLERLFDPFFTTKDVGQGTGLGLSISHGIVQQHGGKIWAENEPGKGAAFIIELPLSPPPAAVEPGITE